jgi:hypothetical protein
MFIMFLIATLLSAYTLALSDPGADSGGGGPGAPPPPKIGKNMIFWRKIVIIHTKYPKSFHASLRSAQFF